MKRLLDVVISACALLVLLPLLLPVCLLIYVYDRHSPFYVAQRVGLHGRPFPMVKLRSMVVNADRSGVTSTAATDSRITPVGRVVRRYKLDELLQLWNVLRGQMSLVGPRPNVPSGVALYTEVERHLLDVRPGITDFASIVFADEGDILRGHADPDTAYDRLIRPYKSRLGLLYVQKSSVGLDLKLLWLTAVALVSRRAALDGVVKELKRQGAAPGLIDVAGRHKPLHAADPPRVLGDLQLP